MIRKYGKKQKKGFHESFFMTLGAIFMLAAIFALPMITVWADSNDNQTQNDQYNQYYVDLSDPANEHVNADGSVNTTEDSTVVEATQPASTFLGTEDWRNLTDSYVNANSAADLLGVPDVTTPNIWVSKTIEQVDENGALQENLFDITLTVQTTEDVENTLIPQPSAIAFTMDISGSMQADGSTSDTVGEGDDAFVIDNVQNNDLLGVNSYVPALIEANIALVESYGASEVARYVSFVTFGSFGNYISYQGDQWFDVSRTGGEAENAKAAIAQLQALKTLSMRDSSATTVNEYIIRYSQSGEIEEIVYDENNFVYRDDLEAFRTKLDTQYKAIADASNKAYDGSYVSGLTIRGISNFETEKAAAYTVGYHGPNTAYTNAQAGLIVANSLLMNHDDMLNVENKNIILLMDGDAYVTSGGNVDKSSVTGYATANGINDYIYTSAPLKFGSVFLGDENGVEATGKTEKWKMTDSDKNAVIATREVIYDNEIAIHPVIYSTYTTPAKSAMETYLGPVTMVDGSKPNFGLDGLISTLNATASTITGSTPWTVIDPMAEYMSAPTVDAHLQHVVTISGKQIEWDLENLKKLALAEKDEENKLYTANFNDDGTYETYTLTYRVELDAHGSYDLDNDPITPAQKLESGKFYPTNERTYLNYAIVKAETENASIVTDKTYVSNGYVQGGKLYNTTGVEQLDTNPIPYTLDFRVPSVEPFVTGLKFTKTDLNGKELANAGFALWRYIGDAESPAIPADNASPGSDWVQVAVRESANNGLVDFGSLGKGFYILKETKAPSYTYDDDVIVAYTPQSNYTSFTIGWGNLNIADDSWLETIDGGLVVENSPATQQIEHKVQKTWTEGSLKPESIEVGLYISSHVEINETTGARTVKDDNGTPYAPVKTVTLNEGNGWKNTFDSVDLLDANGNRITYVIVEHNLSENYTVTYHDTDYVAADGPSAQHILHSLNNDLQQVQINIPVAKEWYAPDTSTDVIAGYPAIKIQLYRALEGDFNAPVAVTGKSITLSYGDESGIFEDLDVYDANGIPYVYSIQETLADDSSVSPTYTQVDGVISINAKAFHLATTDAQTGFSLKNYVTPGSTTLVGTKTWINPENLTLPDFITVTLWKDGAATTQSQQVTAETKVNDIAWSYSFEDQPLYSFTYDNDNNITGYTELHQYTIVESPSMGSGWYEPITSAIDDEYPIDINVKNAYRGNVNVTIEKNWTAENGGNPTVEYILYQNNIKIASHTASGVDNIAKVSPDGFDNLPKYDISGNPYTYDVREVITADEGKSYLMASKNSNWDDAENNLHVAFANYTPKEGIVDITGEKTWLMPEDIALPDSITLTLSAVAIDADGDPVDGITIDDKTLTLNGEADAAPLGDIAETDAWVYKFGNLPQYYNHEITIQESVDDEGTVIPAQTQTIQYEIEYTVIETALPGFSTSYFIGEEEANSTTESATINIVNERNNTETVEVAVDKSWYWINDVALENDVTMTFILQKEVHVDNAVKYEDVAGVSPIEVIIKAGDSLPTGIIATFGKGTDTLPMYDENHQVINYWVKETVSPNVFNGSALTMEIGTDGNQTVNVVNTLIDKYMPISVTKNWEFPFDFTDEQKAALKGAVDFQLYRYTTTNTTPELVATATVAVDATNVLFVPGTDLTTGEYLHGYKNDTTNGIVGWPMYSWNADKTAGEQFIYEIVEVPVADGHPSYGKFTSNADAEDNMIASGSNTVTNTYIIEKDSFEVKKEWVAPEGTVFDAVQFTLYRSTDVDNDGNPTYANGEKAPNPQGAGDYTVEANADNEFTATFENLPRYNDAMTARYYYYVVEADVDGYTRTSSSPEDADFDYTTFDSQEVVNTIDQDYIAITVSKTWLGDIFEGQDHPDSVEVELLRGGQPIDIDETADGVQPYRMTINTTLVGDAYTGSVTFGVDVQGAKTLPKYNLASGELYNYTVVEVGAVDFGNVAIPGLESDAADSNIYYPVPGTDANNPQIYLVNYAKQPNTNDFDNQASDNMYTAEIENKHAVYQYQVIRHYRAVIDGVEVVNEIESDSVQNVTEQYRNSLPGNTYTVSDVYITNNADRAADEYAYIYQPNQGTPGAEVELALAGYPYQIHLYYEYEYESDDPIRRPDPPGPVPDPPGPTPDPPPSIVDIEEDETPLANIPAPIPVPEVVEVPEEILIIEDEVPLGNLPQTGSMGLTFNVLLGLALAMFTVSGLMFGKKVR